MPSHIKLMSVIFSNRLLNAGSQLNLALDVVDDNGNSACDILEIAVDGIYLDRGTPPRLGRSFLVPSSRMDWLIVCNNPGEYYVSLETTVVFRLFTLITRFCTLSSVSYFWKCAFLSLSCVNIVISKCLSQLQNNPMNSISDLAAGEYWCWPPFWFGQKIFTKLYCTTRE